MAPIKTLSAAIAIILLQAAPSHAWTTTRTEPTSPEGDILMHASVRSVSGDATITFGCGEGTIWGELENHAGVNLHGPGAVYAGGMQIGSDGLDSTLSFANWEQTAKLAKTFMKAKGNVDVRYSGKATPREFRDAFPAVGATAALAPLFSSGLCGLE